jgi:hypothetical protein
MNVIRLYNKSFRFKGEKSLEIIFECKKMHEDKLSFLKEVNKKLEVPVENIHIFDEISKEKFEDFDIWKWIDLDNIKIELDSYNNYYSIGNLLYPADSCLLAESNEMYLIVRFFDAC